VYVLNDPISTG